MASTEITPAPVNFAATGSRYIFLAHLAAATLAIRQVDCLVVNADNIAALDEAEFPLPIGQCRFVVVGEPAFNLLPERTQQFVFDPPQPDQSDYFGAIGTVNIEPEEDTANKLVDILNLLVPPIGQGKGFVSGAGEDFRERLKTLNLAGWGYDRVAD